MRELIKQKIVDSLAAPLPTFTRRDIRLPRIAGKATAVVGMRRTGKTTFLWQVLSDRVREGVPREGLLFFGFEDERLAGMAAKDLQIVVEEYYRLHPEWRDKKKAVFAFDEIQAVPGWEPFARRILDTEHVELFVSGSSARLLSREVATSMRGRAMEVLVNPFSFREYLRHRGKEPGGPVDRLPKAARSAMEKELLEYLTCGGFPEAQNADASDRRDLLRGYVDAVLFRDIVERHEETHVAALRWMVRHLLGNPGGSFSVNRFYKDTRSQGLSVTKDKLYDLFSYLEDAFLVRTVSLLTKSERRRMVNPRKVYPVDPGLIPIYDRTGQSETGHALETCVMLELRRRAADIAYVRTRDGAEVDFFALFPDRREVLIQVCADLGDPNVCEREVRGLVEAGREHPDAEKTIVVLHPGPSRALPDGIEVKPAVEWLLS
ncbi:MAG TPA: ATP-binding protein [Candidatus Aminicenantes bacterium]|nr:ATP-binding protein [Candidatus Aminicenantes bacterium]HRY63800.1 ATP-binding protein [Candidatus Aminicenantes bacterium]HRZ70713.1 ATP-binding protein [Candidatus Aminicenantes bacterium]